MRSGHAGVVRSVALGPGGTIVSGSSDNTILQWRAVDEALVREFKANGMMCSTWDIVQPYCTLEGHTSEVRSVAVSPDGSTIASGSDDRTVRVWSLADGSLLHTLYGHRQ